MSDLPTPNGQFTALQQTAQQLTTHAEKICQQIEQQKTLISITDQIRSSLNLELIFQTTATEARRLLNADRVGVFRFIPGTGCKEGEFVSEDVVSGFASAMAVKVQDGCFGSQFATHYRQGQIQAVEDIYQADLSDCHLEFLKKFQVRANLIVPVLKGSELWGLLCIHQCQNPRQWQPSDIEFARKIADHFALALQQTEYLEQIRSQMLAQAQVQAAAQEKALSRQKALVKIVSKIRQLLDLSEICETATEEVRHLLAADRATIYRFNTDWSGDFLFESVADGWKPLVGVSPTIEDTYLMETQGGRYAAHETFAIPDIYTAGHADCHVALLEQFQARAYAIAPIFQGNVLWGLLTAFQNSMPRNWDADEVELLTQIGEQIGIALQQAEYVQKIQTQSVELKQLLQELQQSQIQLIQNEKMASLGQLVAGVAHEINNPVNFIYGNLKHVHEYVTDLLKLVSLHQQHNTQSHDEIESWAEEIDIDFILEDLPKTLSSMKLGADRIRQIVLSLRNFSRLDESELKTVDVHEGIDSTLLILGHRLKNCSDRYQVEVVKEYGELPLIECYPAQLNQVFMNLLANALDAIEEAISLRKEDNVPQDNSQSPKIWISTKLNERDQVEIRIRDTGMGLDEASKSKIFEHFFTTKPVGKGTGLGLAISKKIIVEKHCGTLAVDSVSGQGAEFIIGLPVKLNCETCIQD